MLNEISEVVFCTLCLLTTLKYSAAPPPPGLSGSVQLQTQKIKPSKLQYVVWSDWLMAGLAGLEKCVHPWFRRRVRKHAWVENEGRGTWSQCYVGLEGSLRLSERTYLFDGCDAERTLLVVHHNRIQKNKLSKRQYVL